MPYSPTPVLLAGASRNDGPKRVCQRCSELALPGGGCQMTPSRWICSACWKGRQMAQRNRARSTATPPAARITETTDVRST